MTSFSRPSLRLITAPERAPEVEDWVWFCGHCAAPAQLVGPPPPTARVCAACGFGLMLETRRDAAPSSRQSFLVVDSALRVQALSRAAERFLQVREQAAVNRRLREFLALAEPEGAERSLEALVTDALSSEEQTCWTQVRPAGTFGIRFRARVAPCGPPRAALIVLGAVRPLD